MANVEILISNDPSSLSDSASPLDVLQFARELADVVGDEMGCDVAVLAREIDSAHVSCADTHERKAEAEEILLRILSGEEWNELKKFAGIE